MANARQIGLLTGGGDCPGLNSVIRAVVRKADQVGINVVGMRNGWKGAIENEVSQLDLQAVSGILPRGGTILGTSRTNPYKVDGAVDNLLATLAEHHIDALIAIGGEDTLGVAHRLSQDGLSVVGIPKTIDNDLSATDYTFGFDTAVNIAMEAIDRLHTTAESHHRVIVAEVMGRHAGWIATAAGLAGGADLILIPEISINIDTVCQTLTKRYKRGKSFSIVVVAEGAKLDGSNEMVQGQTQDAFGHVRLGGVGHHLGALIEEQTGFETRVTVLGHIQRGGTPTAFDRILGTRFGVKAVELVQAGQFGRMVSLRGNAVTDVPLSEAVKELKTVDMELYAIAEVFFG